MIEIKDVKRSVLSENQNFSFEQADFEVINDGQFNKKIIIDYIKEEDYYIVELKDDFNERDFHVLLDSDFQDFLKKNSINVDYEILLPFYTVTGNVFFDIFEILVFIGKRKGNAYLRIQLVHDFEIKDDKWGKYSIDYLFDKLVELGKLVEFDDISISKGEDEDDAVRIEFEADTSGNINKFVIDSFESLQAIEKSFERFMSKQIWSNEFEKDEMKFSKELLLPLLRKMKFDNIIFNHGRKEYGRDILFSEMNGFGEIVNYGMQVKVGDISGEVNSDIDKLIGQLGDAFSIPFYNLRDKNQYFISSFIIAISGKYTENAKEKIRNKMSNELLGNVYFWDREKVMELIEKYWNN